MKTRWLARCTPLPALGVFLVHVWLLHRAMTSHTGGEPSYPVDDAFIHLALARNIIQHGSFGVVAGKFAAASSSVLWPWLLALALRVFGMNANVPLWMNVAFGACLPFVVDAVAKRLGEVSALRRALVDVLVVVLMPLPTLATIGMEHVLHAVVLTAFIALAAEDVAERRVRASTLALAALATSVRYESLFAIGLVYALLLVRKAIRAAGALAACGAAPVVAFGVYSKLHGATFLPTSVLLKGRPLAIHDATDAVDLFGGDLLDRFSHEAHLLILGAACAWLAVWSTVRRGFFAPRTIALFVAFGSLAAHVELAGLGWFFRYDSYLVGVLVTVVGTALAVEAPRTTWARMREAKYWLAIIAGLITFGPMLPRVIAAANTTPSAGKNIFEQQVQTARFLARHFPSTPVAINDIGAVAFYRDGPILDLVGLADADVARAKKFKLDEPMSRDDFLRFTRETNVAVIYDEWFKGLVPPTWFRVARWTIPDVVSCAYPSVSIYATKPEAIAEVARAAHEYAPRLPKEVDVEGWAADAFDERIGARDVLEVTMKGDVEAVAVDERGRVQTHHVDVRVRGLDAAAASSALSKASRHAIDVRVVTRHAPRVCATGNVRRTACIDDRAPTFAAVLDAADAVGDGERAAVLRRVGDDVVSVARADAGDLRDGDVVIVP